MADGDTARAVRIDPRETTTLDSLAVECLSRPGHLIRPRRGSFVFLVFQTRAATSGHAVFSFCSCDLSPGLSASRVPFRLSSIISLRLTCDTYLFPNMLDLASDDEKQYIRSRI